MLPEGLLLVATALMCLLTVTEAKGEETSKPLPWRGQHLSCGSLEGAETLERLIKEQLAPLGVNLLVVEVNYNFQFRSHPEISQGSLDFAAARRLSKACKAHGIRLVPLMNCLGHQSWSDKTFSLLREHPEFDETPQIPLNNPDIYCRSWCPLHPGVNPLVFDLMDELLEAFEADALHVGMDEVFLIASDQCPRCRGKNPAELFARAVNDYHTHLRSRGAEMFLWGDRLLDAAKMTYGKWEASANGTAAAVDMVPRDLIICDWHYEPRSDYPSVRFFQEKGFRTLVSPWRNPVSAEALIRCAQASRTERLQGVLFTGWSTGPGGQKLLAGLRGEQGPDQHGFSEALVLQHCLPACFGRPFGKP